MLWLAALRIDTDRPDRVLGSAPALSAHAFGGTTSSGPPGPPRPARPDRRGGRARAHRLGYLGYLGYLGQTSALVPQIARQVPAGLTPLPAEACGGAPVGAVR
jgi:hypothetical protein